MKEYDRTNTGTLARAKEKPKSEKHPTHTGSININGVEYWLSAWVKTAGPTAREPGSQFFSLSVKPKDGYPDRQVPKDVPKGTELTEANWDKIDFDDDKAIPF